MATRERVAAIGTALAAQHGLADWKIAVQGHNTHVDHSDEYLLLRMRNERVPFAAQTFSGWAAIYPCLPEEIVDVA